MSARWLRWILPFAMAALAASAGTASEPVPDYEFVPVGKQRVSKPVPKYRFMFGDPARWAGPVRWRYNHSNAPAPFDSDPAGTLAQVRAGLESWTQVCGVSFVYEGETAIPPNYRVVDPQYGERPDEVNVVGWATLDGDAAGIAWVWYDDDANLLTDSDILLSIERVQSQAEMQRTVTHEWGHAIGLSHSNVGGVLMSGPPETLYNPISTIQRRRARLSLSLRRGRRPAGGVFVLAAGEDRPGRRADPGRDSAADADAHQQRQRAAHAEHRRAVVASRDQ